MKDKSLENCVFVKTILMILVVFGHSIAFWSGHWFTENPIISSTVLKELYNWINSFHIYSFTLVSGYIFAYKIRAGGGYKKYSLFLKNKIKRLLIPYIFSTVIWVAPLSAHFFKWSLIELFKKYILCINPSQLWFLWMLFWVFAIVWPIWKIVDKSQKIGYVVFGVFYGIGVIGNKIFANIFCVWTACQYMLFFYAGTRMNSKKESKKRITKIVPWYVWVILDAAIFVLSIFIRSTDDYIIFKMVSVGLNLSLHVVGAIMAFAILQALASFIDWESSRILKILSSYSMPIYLFHQQIIYFTIVWLNGKVNPWINAGVNFITALTGSLLISAMLMKWKVTRLLIGEKS